jgi:hypothetical protein
MKRWCESKGLGFFPRAYSWLILDQTEFELDGSNGTPLSYLKPSSLQASRDSPVLYNVVVTIFIILLLILCLAGIYSRDHFGS